MDLLECFHCNGKDVERAVILTSNSSFPRSIDAIRFANLVSINPFEECLFDYFYHVKALCNLSSHFFLFLVYFVAIEQKIDLATRLYEDCDANKCEIVPSISNLWTRIAKYHC